MTSKRPLVVTALVVAALLVGILVLRGRHPSPRGEVSDISSAKPPTARLAALDSSFRALHDGDSLTPRDRWDPEYVVRAVGRQPVQLYVWVAENTDWVPYLGTLRGPVGVLMDRQGNSLDRALLLARLLEIAGHPVRLAHGQLTEEEAAAVLPTLVALAAQPSGDVTNADLADPAGVTPVAARYALDVAAISEHLRAQRDGVDRLRDELDARVWDQSERLLTALGAYDADAEWGERLAETTAAVRDHWWVQVQGDSGWSDLDPLAWLVDTAATVLIPATESMPVGAVPAELRHRLAVSVIAEQWSAGALTERAILEQELQPAELYGQPIVLQAWPGRWPAEMNSDPEAPFGLRSAALEQGQWGIVLAVADRPVAQAVLGDDGALVEPPTGGGFGGLGAAIGGLGGAGRAERAGPRRELTAVWIEYELRSVGRPPRTIRRAVFDVLGPAARASSPPATLELDERQRLTRSLALMIRTEILPVTCRIAPEYVTHLTVGRLLENRSLFQMVARSDPARGLPETDTLLATVAPPVSSLYSLAVARLEWSPVGDRVYVDRLGLLTRHRHPAYNEHGFGLRGAIDVAAGDLGVSLAEPDGFRTRLRQGILDTNAEALWWIGAAVLNTGEAFATSRDWLTIPAADRSAAAALKLPADATARIANELASGATVVAPRAPVAAGREHFVGWWSIDPATGAARGVGGHGWGQCAPEYGVTLEAVVIHAAREFAFEYALCQGIAQSVNGFRAAGAELQARGMWFWWVPPIQTEDPLGLFKASNKTCLIGAMMGGMLATMPLLLQVRRLAYLRALAKGRRFLRDERGGIRFPPRLVGKIPPAIPRRPTPAGGFDAPVDPRGPTLPNPNPPPTEPQLNPAGGRPRPGKPAPPPGPPPAPAPAPRKPPLSPGEAQTRLRQAQEAHDAASARDLEATRNELAYNQGRPRDDGIPRDPSWNREEANRLKRITDQADQDAVRAWKELEAARSAARRAGGHGGFQQANQPPKAPAPEPPVCLPRCGNENPTVPAGEVRVPGADTGDAMEVGASGIAGSSIPGGTP